MKKLFLILLAVLMLCSCNLQEEPEVFEESSSSSEISGETSEEKEKNEDEIYYESLDQEGKNMYSHIDKKAIDWNSGTKKLRDYVTIARFENIRFIDDWYYSANLILEKAGVSEPIVIPVKGIYYHSEFYGSREAPYGGFCYPENGKIYFCGLEKIVEIDPDKFTAKELELNFPEKDYDDLWITGIFTEKDFGFCLEAIGLDKKSGEESDGFLWTYDKNGNFVSEVITENSYCIGFDDIVVPMFARETETAEKGEKNYLVRTGTRYAVNAETGEKFYFSDATTLRGGAYKLELIYYYPSQAEYYEGQYLVSFYKNEKLVGEMNFRDENFITADNIDEAKPRLLNSGNGKTATYVCDYFALSVEFDFEKGTHKLEIKPTDKNINEDSIRIDSADGKYTICSFGGHGGGDIYYDLLSVRDNETKEHKYLGQTGGMYGGNSDFGFLKNNDIYIFGTSKLHVFDPETGKVKFDLEENFPLGYDSETDSERGIITFRRDPNDFSFIVLYFEYENGFRWDDNFLGNCNYKIGFLDSEGNLIESYDTGCPMHGSPFGICPIDMRYSEKELKFFGTGGKGGTNLEAVFDMETKEFKIIKE